LIKNIHFEKKYIFSQVTVSARVGPKKANSVGERDTLGAISR